MTRLFFILTVLVPAVLFGQPAIDSISFSYSDTLKFYKASKIDTVQTLEGYGRIVDSIAAFKIYLLDDGEEDFLARKIRDKFYVIGITTNSVFLNESSPHKITQIDFSGNNLDIKVDWSNEQSASSYEGGFTENTGGIQVWDMKNFVRYFDMKTVYFIGIGYNEIVNENGDTLHKGGKDIEVCQEYVVNFKPKELTIEYLDCREIWAKQNKKVINRETHTYNFTKFGLIKRK